MECDTVKCSLLLLNVGALFLYHQNQPLNIRNTYPVAIRILGIASSALLQTVRPSLEKSAKNYFKERWVKWFFDASPFVIMGGVFALTGLAWKVNLLATTLFGIQHFYTFALLQKTSDMPLPQLGKDKLSLLFSASLVFLYVQCQKPHLMHSNRVRVRVVGIITSFLVQEGIRSNFEKPQNGINKLFFDALPFLIMGSVFALTKLSWKVNLLATTLFGTQHLYVHSLTSSWKDPEPALHPLPPPIDQPQNHLNLTPPSTSTQATQVNFPVHESNSEQLEITLQNAQAELKKWQEEAEHFKGICKTMAHELSYVPFLDEELRKVPEFTRLVEELITRLHPIQETEKTLALQEDELQELQAKLLQMEGVHAELLAAVKSSSLTKKALEETLQNERANVQKDLMFARKQFDERLEGLREVLTQVRQDLEAAIRERDYYRDENTSLTKQNTKQKSIIRRKETETLEAQEASKEKGLIITDEQEVIARLKNKIFSLEQIIQRLQDSISQLEEDRQNYVEISRSYKQKYFDALNEKSALQFKVQFLNDTQKMHQSHTKSLETTVSYSEC